MNISALIKNNNVEFLYYQRKELWYKIIGTDFVFPVPIEDTGDGKFLPQDKAIMFMRYIRQALEKMEEEPNGKRL